MYYRNQPQTNQKSRSRVTVNGKLLSTKRIFWSQFWAREAAEARESPSWNDHLTAPVLLLSFTGGMEIIAFCSSSMSKLDSAAMG